MKLYKLIFCLLALFLVGCSSSKRLEHAITSEEPDELKAALSKWGDINGPLEFRDEYVGTPLTIACQQGKGASALILLEAGADPNARDKEGATALHYAVQSRNSHITDALLRFKADPNAMVEPVPNGKETYRAPRYDLPLILAATSRNVRAVKRLLASGAKVDGKDRFHRTTFWHLGGKMTADKEQKLNPAWREIRRLLLKAGANPDPRDNKGERNTIKFSPFHEP